MKTLDDIYGAIGIPCRGCKYLWSKDCSYPCINLTLRYMYTIAENMVLRGEY